MIGVNIKKLSSRCLRTVGRIVTIGVVLSALTVTFLTASSVDKGFLKSTDKYDYIVGSRDKASQISLDSVYFVSTPKSTVGNSYYEMIKDVKTLKSVVPIKQCDEYKGLQVIGTTRDFFEGEVLKEGRLFSDKSKEIVIGSNVAESKNLFLGSKIQLTHRTINDGGIVGEKVAGPDDGKPYPHEGEYTVVGILDGGNTVYDNLLYMDISDSHQLHGVSVSDSESEDSEGKKSVIDEIDTVTVNGILIKTGGSTGLNDLQKLLHNDKGVSLYKLEESASYVKEVRGNIEKVYPVFVAVMFVLLSLILSLVHLGSVRTLKKDISAMVSVRVPKSDIITYVILDSVIVTGLGALLSYPIMGVVVKYLNSLVSSWSLIISMSGAYLITMVVLPVILAYICVISFIIVNGVYEEA